VDSVAKQHLKELISWELLLTLISIVAMVVVKRYVIGGILWLDGLAGTILVPLVIGLASIAFLIAQILQLRTLKREAGRRKSAGESRLSFQWKQAVLFIASLYCVFTSAILLSVEQIIKPSAGERRILVQRIFETPPWSGDFIRR
jgi:hypothetical protein